MSVYVDQLRIALQSTKWQWPTACHLIADEISELYDFAVSLGLKICYFQLSTGNMPHYDLNENMRNKALSFGAIEISTKEIIDKMHIYRREHW